MNDNNDGFLVEIAAGMLDKDNPEACVIRETEEEVGYRLKEVKKVYEAYSSPGVMTEKMHFFVGAYTDDMRVNEGGGLDSEHEDIEVLELPFKDAIQLTETGDRLLYTAILYRQQNQKPKVIISAGERDYLKGEQKNRLEANDISNILEGLGVDEGNIRLESVSRDIRSSAVIVKELLEKEGLSEQKLILITSAINASC